MKIKWQKGENKAWVRGRREGQGTKGECKEKAVQSFGCVKKWEAKGSNLAAATGSESREQGNKMFISNQRREDDQNMEKVSEGENERKCLSEFIKERVDRKWWVATAGRGESFMTPLFWLGDRQDNGFPTAWYHDGCILTC